jgi:hypothetical protein
VTHPLFSFVVVPALVLATYDVVGFSPFLGCFLFIKFGTFGEEGERKDKCLSWSS